VESRLGIALPLKEWRLERLSSAIMTGNNSQCRICGCERLQMVKASNIGSGLSSSSFSITDSHYGVTAAIYRCASCGFLQCSDLPEVLPFYKNLEDGGYEAGRRERSLQARRILKVARTLRAEGRLLDIGAGSGMLVEQALQMGYQAEGVEPSSWLHGVAQKRNLPVHLGTFPNSAPEGQFDIVTLIDVIEHVSDPLQLLRNIAERLSPSGIAVIVTPDADSVAARIFGWRWWHFRVAHIGYFNKQNLLLAMDRVGLRPVLVRRPGWFFAADYLWVRTHRYLPKFLRLAPPNWLSRLTIPVNLRDSWLIGCVNKPRLPAFKAERESEALTC
jgi:SAM-dependent methyltransferase